MITQFNNKPVNTLRDGNLKAVIWENIRDGKTYRSVDLYRTYKNEKEGKLKDIAITLLLNYFVSLD